MVRTAHCAACADKAHRDPFSFPHDIKRDLIAIEPHRAAALPLHEPAVHLAGYLPLALAEHVIDRRANRRQRRLDPRGRLVDSEVTPVGNAMLTYRAKDVRA